MFLMIEFFFVGRTISVGRTSNDTRTVLAQENVQIFKINKISDEKIIKEILSVFGINGREAVRVGSCESNLQTTAISPTNDVGIFQINLAAHGQEIATTRKEQIAWLEVPEHNVEFAYSLFLKNGWKDWSPSHTCHWL